MVCRITMSIKYKTGFKKPKHILVDASVVCR